MLIKNNSSSTTLRLLSLASLLSHAENKWAVRSLTQTLTGFAYPPDGYTPINRKNTLLLRI